MRLILGIVAALVAAPALAEDSPFIDDRSTPQQVLASFYNAIERHHFARAFSYFGEYSAPEEYKAWSDPLWDVDKADFLVGAPTHYSTAGEIAYDFPVMVGFTLHDGTQRYEVGCIGVVYTIPHDAEPPYRSMYIAGYRMAPHPADDTLRLPTCED